MKDITKVINRMKKACADIEGMEAVHTVQEGIDVLAKNITLGGGKPAVALFKKYAIYDAEYVRENLSVFYDLIVEDVVKAEDKDLKKAGASDEEIERGKLVQTLGENRTFGYARVSTAEQNLERQIIELEKAGCQVIFQEKKSGKNVNRTEFQSLMNLAKEGDTIVISELTRLARSTTDLFKIVAELDEKGVALKSLKEHWLDTTTAQGRLMFTIMSGLAQFERELMLERQKEGIQVAKNSGTVFGRKLEENADMATAIALVKEGKYTMTKVAEMCHISRTTLWRKCKALGILD